MDAFTYALPVHVQQNIRVLKTRIFLIAGMLACFGVMSDMLALGGQAFYHFCITPVTTWHTVTSITWLPNHTPEQQSVCADHASLCVADIVMSEKKLNTRLTIPQTHILASNNNTFH